MWWPLVAQDDSAGALRLPLAFASHQQFDAAVEPVNLTLLAGHDVGQVVDTAQKMGELFFEFFHGLDLGGFARLRNGAASLAQPAVIR